MPRAFSPRSSCPPATTQRYPAKPQLDINCAAAQTVLHLRVFSTIDSTVHHNKEHDQQNFSTRDSTISHRNQHGQQKFSETAAATPATNEKTLTACCWSCRLGCVPSVKVKCRASSAPMAPQSACSATPQDAGWYRRQPRSPTGTKCTKTHQQAPGAQRGTLPRSSKKAGCRLASCTRPTAKHCTGMPEDKGWVSSQHHAAVGGQSVMPI